MHLPFQNLFCRLPAPPGQSHQTGQSVVSSQEVRFWDASAGGDEGWFVDGGWEAACQAGRRPGAMGGSS